MEKIEGETIHFSDGTTTAYDVLIFAIGYTTGLTKMLPDHTHVMSENGLPLNTAKDMGEGLYFIGFNETPRGLLNEINREALQIAKQIAG